MFDLYAGVDVDDIEVLKDMSNLTPLHMWNTQLTAEQVDKLQESLPKCDMWPLQNR